MKRAMTVFMSATLIFAGAACSEAERDQAAEDIQEGAEEAGEDVREAGEEAADRAEDVINDRQVRIEDNKFDPVARKVKVGTEVTWINRDSVDHTVTSDTDAFDSGDIAKDKEFSFRFTQSGSYAYHCEIHGKDVMSGTIVVE